MSQFGRRAAITTLAFALFGCAGSVAPHHPGDDEFVGSPDDHGVTTEGSDAAAAPRRSGALWYRMSMEGSSLRVRLRLASPPERMSFFLPGTWAGRDDHHAAITLRRARTPKGARTFTLNRAERRVDVDVGQASWVELSYDVALVERGSDHERFSPQRVSAGWFAYATTLLVLPSARVCGMLADIPIEVRVPHTFKVASNWPLAHDARSRTNPEEHVYGYVAPDVASLRDAFVTAHDRLEVDDGPGATIVYERAFEGDRVALSGAIRRIVAHYERLFGPQRAVTALVRAPHTGSARTLWGTGRREGFVLELAHDAPVDVHTRILIAHEAFHLWNGHQLIPSPEASARTQWFKEGVTQYVALNALAHLGVLSERDVLDEWARVAARYQRTIATPRGRVGAVMAEQLPYDRGLLIALALDLALREDPNSDSTLDDWILAMLEERDADADTRYGEADLLTALTRVAPQGSRAAAVWTASVTRHEPIDTPALFEALGLHYLPPSSERAPRLIPLEDRRALFRSLLGAHPQERRPAH